MPPFLEKIAEKAPPLRWPIRFGWRFSERWNADACPLMAAAMAFFGLLSIFPLALAGVAILARFLVGNSSALSDFSRFVAGFFPGAAGKGISISIQHAVLAIASGPNATTVGIFALASLLWSGRAYFDTLATILNRVFPGATPRSFIGHQLTLWALLLGVGILFFFSTFISLALSVAQSLAYHLPDLFLNRAPFFWYFLGKLSAWTLTFAMFSVLYRFGPNRATAPHRRIILISALVATMAWEIAKLLFARFLGNVTRYEATYGSVSGVIVTMLWIYFSSLIILAGAEVGATIEDLKSDSKQGKIAA